MSISWRGNRKLSWPTWSLPACVTCPNKTPECERTCYAFKAERQYPSVRKSRKANLKASKQKAFVEIMSLEINRRKPKIFRVHESGDFYDKEYFRKWILIAIGCPDTRFYAFTKVYDLFRFKLPSNFVLIASIYYDEKRKPPKLAPKFYTVRKGETGHGQRCHGHCDDCGICPYAEASTVVWAEVH